MTSAKLKKWTHSVTLLMTGAVTQDTVKKGKGTLILQLLNT